MLPDTKVKVAYITPLWSIAFKVIILLEVYMIAWGMGLDENSAGTFPYSCDTLSFDNTKNLNVNSTHTTQKIKLSIKEFFGLFDQLYAYGLKNR